MHICICIGIYPDCACLEADKGSGKEICSLCKHPSDHTVFQSKADKDLDLSLSDLGSSLLGLSEQHFCCCCFAEKYRYKEKKKKKKRSCKNRRKCLISSLTNIWAYRQHNCYLLRRMIFFSIVHAVKVKVLIFISFNLVACWCFRALLTLLLMVSLLLVVVLLVR